MLINKFQRRQEQAKGRELWARHNMGHWRCPFFKYYWEEGIKLPIAKNCPECNGAYNNSSSSKEVCFDDRRPTAGDHGEFSNQLILVHDRLGSKANVHDRLGGKASIHDRLGGRVKQSAERNGRFSGP
jgi:hypothetical protein